MECTLQEIQAQAARAAAELLDAAGLRPGDIFVVGCSSSEIMGGHIGKASSLEAARAVFTGIYPLLEERGLYLAAQCCEHLNRALIVEADCAAKYGYDPVSVRPQPKAGGSFAATAWECFRCPAAVEQIRAHAGLDIGGTLIGMHLRPVAVPVRLSLDHIGQAALLCARTRPKFIGGSRACYEGENR
ncbi:MAG: TIGR01440 family protein [Oscillospiraceae bacterium]|nr:TIGR01440 family protein [Oscillospiraceae bacterium]